MNSLSIDPPLKRHDLVVIDPIRWEAITSGAIDNSHREIVTKWAVNGWPLVVRRPEAHEAIGVSLGLPLPAPLGKTRLPFVAQRRDILSARPPLSLSSVKGVAPASWRSTIDVLEVLSDVQGVKISVFGSVAWEALTGLNYMTDASDLDLLFHVRPGIDLDALASRLALIDARSPMRIDGEFVGEDGKAANWREFHLSSVDILVKSINHVTVEPKADFLSEGSPR
jgi:phosphoribosyl-dephospho-CoA transferase